MDQRQLAARNLLAQLEALGIVLWVDNAERRYVFRDPALATTEIREMINAHSRELETLLAAIGCRDGFVRGKTRWHVAVVRGWSFGGLEYACNGGRGYASTRAPFLPRYAPGGDLCTRCVRHLVDRELARLCEPMRPACHD